MPCNTINYSGPVVTAYSGKYARNRSLPRTTRQEHTHTHTQIYIYIYAYVTKLVAKNSPYLYTDQYIRRGNQA